MERIFADFHIHLGNTLSGNPVKISASKNLTLPNVLETSFHDKGIQMVGIIDCHVPEVIYELEQMMEKGELTEHREGGLIQENGCLILGSEIEIYDENCRGPIHVLVFLPYLRSMKHFSNWLVERMTNRNLSSQRFYGEAAELQKKTKELDGLFVIAHAFTPFKSLYGKGVEKSLVEVFQPEEIDAIELGLSCDTRMAGHVGELEGYPFLSNSDAHSLEKIGREYQSLEVKELSFREFSLALKGLEGRNITGNYGLHPQLGKYFRTCCAKCGTLITSGESITCPHCKKGRIVKGVSNRINELSDSDKRNSISTRPPYTHHVPLEFIPGIGPRMLNKLRERFGTDMEVIHFVSDENLLEVLPARLVDKIIDSRNGNLSLKEGGGGRYGKLD
ncbi:endonuclease Q family protein [Pseudalkalibacillus salsuginis]|uniref:endonuclease Q family protein n=1 Tax=Pseudalkalibacillus salsuginis TaxID=2910972 RepID=UPI001F214AC3|nr:endonuclease Q family protein [Pseudalkalibacillus salsuginis]MCF6408312.1 endonuclease Q family protein [Pseudalkalibacillus salsuginis]